MLADEKEVGVLGFPLVLPVFESFEGASFEFSSSSCKLPQAPHSKQRPVHFEVWAPHLAQA